MPSSTTKSANSPEKGKPGSQVQVSDQALLDLMRSEASFGVGELAERLGVTDTAVRQRLTRLMDRGFVQRVAVREGRGRPRHMYQLTELGLRASGANLEDLAVALWQEVIDLEDSALRERMVERVVERLARRYAMEVVGETPTQRMRSVVDLFNRRGIPFSLEEVSDDDFRLKILGCPYPGLADNDRYVCLMEQMLFQRLIGSSIGSIACDVSPSGCCEYVPLGSDEAAVGSQKRDRQSSGAGSCGGSGTCRCHGSERETDPGKGE